MKVQAFWEGCVSESKIYDDTHPDVAAACYAETYTGKTKQYGGVISVVPIDDEAKAAYNWMSDDEGMFLLYKARPTTTWTITEKEAP